MRLRRELFPYNPNHINILNVIEHLTSIHLYLQSKVEIFECRFDTVTTRMRTRVTL